MDILWKVKRLSVLMVLSAVLATGCVNTGKHLEDGYQFGDGLATAYEAAKDLIIMRRTYCSVSDPIVKADILRTIHVLYPDYPEEGICTGLDGILDAVEEHRAEEAVEAAMEDYRVEEETHSIGAEPIAEEPYVGIPGMGKSTSSPEGPSSTSDSTVTSGS